MERVYAAEEVTGGNLYTGILAPTGGPTTLQQVFNFILNLVMGVGWSLVIIMLALGFVQYVMSKGEKTAVKTAQDWITYAAIGGAGLLLLMALRTILVSLIGAGALNVTGVSI